RAGRARHPRRDARPRAGACVGRGALPQPAPDRVWQAGRDADASGPGSDVRRADRPPARRRRGNGRDPAAAPSLMHALIEPWQHGFMQRALLELVLLGVVGAVLGSWVLVYELAFSAESLAHALFPGLVVAALLGVPLVAGGAVGVLAAAAGVAVFGRTPEIGRDTAVAVVITTLFGLGVVLALSPASPPGLDNLLFGDLLGVSTSDLVLAGCLAAGSLVVLAALYRPLLALGFDRG